MTEQAPKYIAYRKTDQFGKEFYSAKEAAEFFGVKVKSLRVVARDRHAIKGKQTESWMIFPADMLIIDVESELERRL